MRGKYGDNAEKVCGAMEKKMASDVTETFEENGKFFIKAFLLDSSINQNAWGVDPSTLEQNINTYIGKPLVLQDDFQHPDSGDSNYDHHMQYQEKFRIGNIIDIVNKDSVYSAIIEVTDQQAKDAFKKGDLPLYVSPQLFHDGVGKEADTATKTWRGTNLAVVKEPAFGIMKARVEGQCSGSPMTCLAQLKRASVDKTKCNCIQKAIANFKNATLTGKTILTVGESGSERVSNHNTLSHSSLDKFSQSSSILDGPQPNANPQISKEEFEKIRLERDELKAKVASLEGVNSKLTEENKTVSASLDSLKGEYRKDKVASILSNVSYKTDEERAQNVETFTKSGMTYEEIEKVTSPIKKASVTTDKETKLPVKSASTEESEMPYWALINDFIVGGNA